MKYYEDIWYKPSTWNPVSAPFGWAAIILIVILILAFITGPY